MFYSTREKLHDRLRSPADVLLKFTLWFFALAALAAGVFFVRHLRDKRSDRRVREHKASQRKQSRAEADRRACLDLAKGLNVSAPAGEDGDAASNPRSPAGERTRRSSEAPQGFDPDLPARPARVTTP